MDVVSGGRGAACLLGDLVHDEDGLPEEAHQAGEAAHRLRITRAARALVHRLDEPQDERLDGRVRGEHDPAGVGNAPRAPRRHSFRNPHVWFIDEPLTSCCLGST